MQVKNLHIHKSISWEGSEVKVWRGLVEDLCVYFLEPQNGYVAAYSSPKKSRSVTSFTVNNHSFIGLLNLITWIIFKNKLENLFYSKIFIS